MLHPAPLLTRVPAPCRWHAAPAAEAYADAQLHKRKLIPIKLFASNRVDPHTKLYYIMAALSRGHPIACGLK